VAQGWQGQCWVAAMGEAAQIRQLPIAMLPEIPAGKSEQG
jgi:hypothetical protein